MISKRMWAVAVCMILCVPGMFGCKAQTTYGEFSYFGDGTIQTKSFDEMRRIETEAKGNEELAWKTEPVLVVQKEMIAFLPELRNTATETKTVEKNGWKAITASSDDTTVECFVATQEKNRVVVNILVNELPKATAELKRPFGGWWYVTAFEYKHDGLN